MAKENADDVDVVEYTVRAPCRACGKLYVWPKGSVAPGGIGPCCQVSLFDDLPEPVEAAPVEEQPERLPDLSLEPVRDLGHLGLVDVLCSGCRERPADGRLTPGVPLCVECAGQTIDHWLAWLENPQHDWWPSDDPFGSARHPVEGWRESIRD